MALNKETLDELAQLKLQLQRVVARVVPLEAAATSNATLAMEEEPLEDLLPDVPVTQLPELPSDRAKAPPWELLPTVSLLDTGVQFFAQLTDNVAADAPAQNRWHYAWAERVKTVAGYGGWTAPDPARSGTTTSDPARNLVEDMNNNAGVEGNGVNVANLDTADYTFAIQPIPAGVIVVMHEVVLPDETKEYWFSVVNGVDGTCD